MALRIVEGQRIDHGVEGSAVSSAAPNEIGIAESESDLLVDHSSRPGEPGRRPGTSIRDA